MINNRGIMLLTLLAATLNATTSSGRVLTLQPQEVDNQTLNDCRLGVKTPHTHHAEVEAGVSSLCVLGSACNANGALGWGPVVNKCMPTSSARGVGAVTAHILPIHLLMLTIMGPKWCMYGAGKFWFYQWWGWYIQPATTYLGDYIEKMYNKRDFLKNKLHRRADQKRVDEHKMAQAEFNAKYLEYNGKVYKNPISTDGTNDPFLTGELAKSTVHFAGNHADPRTRVEDEQAKQKRHTQHEYDHRPHVLRAQGEHDKACCIETSRKLACPFNFVTSLASCICCPVTSAGSLTWENLPHNCAEWRAGRQGGFSLRRRRAAEQRQTACAEQGAVTTEARAAENAALLSDELKQSLMDAIKAFRCCHEGDCFSMEKLQADVGLVFPTLAGVSTMSTQQRLELAIFEQIVADPELSDVLLAHRPHAANLHNFLCGDNVYIQGRYGVVRAIDSAEGDQLEITLSTDMSASQDFSRYLAQYSCFKALNVDSRENEIKYLVDKHDLEIGNAGISGSLFQFHNGDANKFWADKSVALFEQIDAVKDVLRGAANADAPLAIEAGAWQAGDLEAALARTPVNAGDHIAGDRPIDAEADAALEQLPAIMEQVERAAGGSPASIRSD